MSKAHRRRSTNLEDVDFASLFRRFEQEYGDAYGRLAAQLRQDYPEITKRGRRTGRALRNICFFVWACCRDGDRELIPPLFHAAVLLSAQDDFYDNARISAARKESFCAAINDALRAGTSEWRSERSPQLRDLTALWSYVAGAIPRRAPHVRSYWIESACRLNEAMAVENRAVRRATITFEAYMRTAIHSIGMVFVWATYLAHEHVRLGTIQEMAPVLLHGARVVRLSNDIASYRLRKNRTNAVALVGGRSPEVRTLRLVVEESRTFHASVEALDLTPHVRAVLVHSMDFLREFYKRSDFDRGRAW